MMHLVFPTVDSRAAIAFRYKVKARLREGFLETRKGRQAQWMK
jgi:hypothetical protein